MKGSQFSQPAKRTISSTASGIHNTDPNSTNGYSKRPKHTPQSSSISPGHVTFRLLCNVSRIGGVIGKSGCVIKQLQQATSAKIRVEDALSDCPDRVISIFASSAIKTTKMSLNVTSELNVGLHGGLEVEVSPAQEALIRVFERILDVAAEAGACKVMPESTVSVRLLVETSQVGFVIGKGGKNVKKVKKETGCEIRASPAEKLPCASPTDDIVEIEGVVLAVKKALIAVSSHLQEGSRGEKNTMISTRALEADHHETLPNMRVELPQRTKLLPSSSITYGSEKYPLSSLSEVDQATSFNVKTLHEEVKFRILCSIDRVGGVIGKGGSIIKALVNETGATINIEPSVFDCDERVITITAFENTELRYSPAQNAVIQVFNRSVEAGIEKGLDLESNKGSPIITRLLISSDQVGCLLGKGGTIVAEMRRVTGAGIRVIGPDQVPKCASENDQIIQISGEFSNVQDALYYITGRLRENLFPKKPRDQAGIMVGSSVLSELSPYPRMRDSSTFLEQPSIDISRNFNRNTSLVQRMDHLEHPSMGISHNFDRDVSLKQSMDHLEHPSIGISHNFNRDVSLKQSMDHLEHPSIGISRNFNRDVSLKHSMDHLEHPSIGISRNFNRDVSLKHNMDHLEHPSIGISHNLNRDVSLYQSMYHIEHPSIGISHNLLKNTSLIHSNDHLEHPSFGTSLSHRLNSNANLIQSMGHLEHPSIGFHNLNKNPSPIESRDHSEHPSIDISHSFDRITSIDHLTQYYLDRPIAPNLWESPSQTIAGVGSQTITNVGRGLTSLKGGLELGSGSRRAMVTNTSIQIVVPDNVIGCVYGENGSNLARLKQISGAKVTMHEADPDTRERVVVISGTPDETQAAQSLIHAFILTGGYSSQM